MNKAKKLPYLIAACLSTVILAIVNSSFGVMLVPITEHYLDGEGASRGYPNSAMQIGCIIAVIALAFFGSRINGGGKTLMLVLSCLVMAASLFALGGEPASFAVFVGIFCVLGLAYGAIDVISSALVADVYGESASSMMCLLHGSHGAAGIVAPIAVTYILSRTESGASWTASWTLPYTCIAAFVALVLVYLLILYPSSRRALPAPVTDEKSAEKAPKLDRRLIPIMVSICLYGVYLVGMINYTESYENALSPERQSLVTLSLLYLGLTASRLLLPVIKRLTGFSSRTYLSVAPLISAALLFGGVLSENATAYIILSALSSLVAGAFIPIAISCACEIMVGNTTGASTYMNLAMLIGNSVSSPLIGAVGGAFNTGVGMLIPATALIFCGVFALVGRKKD